MKFLKYKNCVHIMNWNYLIKWAFWAFRKLSVYTTYHQFLFSIKIFIILPYIYFILEPFSSWTYVHKICLYFVLNIVIGYSSTFFFTVFRHVIHPKSQHQQEIDFLHSLDSEWWLIIGLPQWWMFDVLYVQSTRKLKPIVKWKKICL